MEFRKLSQCTLEEAILAWNRGFEGYSVQMKITSDIFIKRMVQEDLSPESSVVAFDKGEPVGIVMNGIRNSGEQKVAWNGGTGIATTHRGTGLSNQFMEQVLKIYDEEKINVATLEAIEDNERAIKLYKKFGYEIMDNLVFLEKTSSFDDWDEADKDYTFEAIQPEQLPSKSIYNKKVPWQCQWQSLKAGEAMLVYKDREIVGYTLFKRMYNESGKVERVNFYQLIAVNLEIIPAVLKKVLSDSLLPIKITAINFSASDPVTKYLLNKGFEKTVGQVYMTKNM